MKKLILVITALMAFIVSANAQNLDSLYQAKLKHPDTLTYTVTSISNFRALQRDFEELRKKLAVMGAYDEAKSITGLSQRISSLTILQVTDPEVYNPKKSKPFPVKKDDENKKVAKADSVKKASK